MKCLLWPFIHYGQYSLFILIAREDELLHFRNNQCRLKCQLFDGERVGLKFISFKSVLLKDLCACSSMSRNKLSIFMHVLLSSSVNGFLWWRSNFIFSSPTRSVISPFSTSIHTWLVAMEGLSTNDTYRSSSMPKVKDSMGK